MRRKLETCKDKSQLIKIAMDCMQTEVDKITNDHNEHLKKLFESHNAQISETKKKQWVSNLFTGRSVIWFEFICSAITASRMRYTIAAGTLRIVHPLVNSSTGRPNIRKCAGASDSSFYFVTVVIMSSILSYVFMNLTFCKILVTWLFCKQNLVCAMKKLISRYFLIVINGWAIC